ncbi:MAG: exonuclease SbcCD subunit D [Anaerolineales bacterium]|nr:exonuclease SbcCD subunit D [Anaerolineales bacterium]
MPRVLHFSDAHIDMVNYGRHDPQTGLPVRVMDFLKSLDTIVDTAVDEKVDLVLFAGDAFKDRNPAPTFQREWGKRIMRLSRADIPTVLLVGNHDLSPSLGRAHALESYDTLEVPHVRTIDKPTFLAPADLEGLPLQIIAMPWIARSGLIAHLGMSAVEPGKIYEEMERRLIDLINDWLEKADPILPTILTAHASVQGAKYGSERTVMLGEDLALSGSLVRDPRLDYVALGHIHKPQDLNPGGHPPVIYSGSIERIDFGEVDDEKFFVIADVEKGNTIVNWRKLDHIRPFVDRFLRLKNQEGITEQLITALPSKKKMEGAIVRLTLEYPRDWESLIDEASIREYASAAFEFHLVKKPHMETRIRLPQDQSIGSLSPLDLLEKYFLANHIEPGEIEDLKKLAAEILNEPDMIIKD